MTANTTAAMSIEPCGHVGKVCADPNGYRNSFRYREPTPLDLVTVAERTLADAWAKDCAIHEANAAAIAHNKALREQVAAAMKAAGIPEEWSDLEFPSSRSRYKKRVTKRAGYLSDLSRWIPVDDGFATQQSYYERAKARHAEYRVKAEEEARRAEAARAAEKEEAARKRKADLDLARIILRYELPDDADWADVLAALRKRDKYLDLAVAMAETRADWNDGPYRVKHALDRFTIENDQDKDIAADVALCLAEYDGDGRIFRDTRWGYGALFELVGDKQLLADAQRAREAVQDQ